MVLSGGSVSAAAQRLGRSREQISNIAWGIVTSWALEFERRPTPRYNERGDGSEQRTFVERPTAVPSP